MILGEVLPKWFVIYKYLLSTAWSTVTDGITVRQPTSCSWRSLTALHKLFMYANPGGILARELAERVPKGIFNESAIKNNKDNYGPFRASTYADT